MTATLPLLETCSGADDGDVGLALQLLVERHHGRLVLGVVDRADDLQGPVEARAEALGEQVVGLTGRGARRVGARVGTAEVQGEEGYADEDDGDERDERELARVLRHGVGPALPGASS